MKKNQNLFFNMKHHLRDLYPLRQSGVPMSGNVSDYYTIWECYIRRQRNLITDGPLW